MTKYINAGELMQQRPENLNTTHIDHDIAQYNRGWNACNELWLSLIEEMPAADVKPVGKWIGVDERLPETEQDVLVAFDDGFVATACIEKDGDWGLWQDSGEVTHWQPLPEPPKMDGGNKKNGEN